MVALFGWVLVYCMVTALSIVLLGDRSLISGDLLSIKAVLRLVFHWKFFLSMAFALIARAAFIMVNNALLGISHLASNSTTITALVLASAYIFVIITNLIMLQERLTLSQGFGAFLIMTGIVFTCR